MLSVKERKAKLKDLGYGYSPEEIKRFQKAYMLRRKDWDGIYGPDTDKVLQHVWNVKHYCNPKNFKPEEFRCECGGKCCSGYPDYMKPHQLMHIQAIRDHYGVPMIITCGLRCKAQNKKLNGSISNSKHMTGQATDFYMKGVTDTLPNRKSAIRWIKTQPFHTYTYGNGINSYGSRVSAPYMGNALHTDTK